MAICGAHREGLDALADTRVGRHVAGQIVRSGIAAAPNYDQARSGESRADFVHKVNVALKELAETRGWLKFIILAGLLPARRVAVLVDEYDQLCRILENSIATAKAARKPGPGEGRLKMTNDKFSIKESEILKRCLASRTCPKKVKCTLPRVKPAYRRFQAA